MLNRPFVQMGPFIHAKSLVRAAETRLLMK